MKRIIRLTESDLARIVKRVIKEQRDVESLRSAVPTLMNYYQFDTNYFKKNPRGVIKMEEDNTFPNILKINNMSVNDPANFNEFWNGDGQDFGRGFRTGNGVFNYNWDGTKLNITGGSGNEQNCRPKFCYYNPKQ